MAYPAQSDIGDLSDFVTSTKVTLTDAVLAVVVMLAGWLIARLARRGVLKLLGRLSGISEDLRQLAARMVFYFLLLLGFGIALTFVGANIQPLLAAAIILTVVAALALRGIAENFAAGIVIQTRRPIELGDDVEVLDERGIVEEINGRSVVLRAWDGRRIHIPNGKVLENPLVNRSAREPQRSEVEVRLRATDMIPAATGGLLEVIAGVDGVVADPPPQVLVRAVDPARLVLVVRFTHAQANTLTIVSRVVTAIAESERARGRDATVIAPPSVAALTPPAPL